jgi:hypothetical protein
MPAPLTGRLSSSLSPALMRSMPSERQELVSLPDTHSPVLPGRGAMDLLPPPLSLQCEAPAAYLFQTMPAPPHPRATGLARPVLSNLDSLLNSGYDNGMLERAASEQAPEPHLPFHATIGDVERRYPRLGGQELYSSLLGSLRESVDRRMRNGGLLSRRDSSLALDSVISVGGGGPPAMARPPSQLLSMDTALARLQMTVEDGAFGPNDVLPVHQFLPNIRVRVLLAIVPL